MEDADTRAASAVIDARFEAHEATEWERLVREGWGPIEAARELIRRRVERKADWAFADALRALSELGFDVVVERLIERWPEVDPDVLRRAGFAT